MNSHSLRIAHPQFDLLMRHLFPGDGDEHGAVLSVGTSRSGSGTQLLVRDVFVARDGVDYVPGKAGYRALTANFVARVSDYCAREQLGYLGVHCHGGADEVAFSGIDLESHRRGYPALLDITNGGPVGALVFARNAAAGQIWTRSSVSPLTQVTVVGSNHRRLYPAPRGTAVFGRGAFDRQAMLFGPAGQQILREATVGIIGLGGAGSLVSQWLAHLGVGHVIGIDFDKTEPSNRPRVVGATRWDSMDLLWAARWPWLRRLGRRMASHKVRVARRVARRANPEIEYSAIIGDVVEEVTAARLKDVDYLFLCADSAQSRLVFNALVHQYLIPGVQIGSKVQVDRATGRVGDVFTVSRPVMPHLGGGCLLCNGLISPGQLQDEAISAAERDRQRYVDDPDVRAPSVITLNALAAAQAANDFLMGFLGLHSEQRHDGYLLHFARERRWMAAACRGEAGCTQCGNGSRSIYARGDGACLPCKG